MVTHNTRHINIVTIMPEFINDIGGIDTLALKAQIQAETFDNNVIIVLIN